MNTKSVSNSGRNYGIDALRLLTMYMVVLLHIIGLGGLRKNMSGAASEVVYIVSLICICSVNCFALISGYVGYSDQERPYRFSKYASLWLQVAFYSFGVTLLVFLVKPELIGLRTLVRHALPVSTLHYWYFSAYSMLFFLIPWFNKLVRGCTKREMSLLVLALFGIFSCFGTFASFFNAKLGLEGGYTFVWLAVLYLVGAWMKKCGVPEKIKSAHAWLCLIVSVSLTFLCHLAGIDEADAYISPMVFFQAASLLVIFAKMRPGPRACRLIGFFAPAAFGVYLLHLQQTVYKYFIKEGFSWIAEYSLPMVLILMLLCAGGIFLVCLLAEKLRILIFTRLGINRCAENLFNWAGKKLIGLLDKSKLFS